MSNALTAEQRTAYRFAKFETHLKRDELGLARFSFLALVTTKFGGETELTINQAYLNATHAYAEHITSMEHPTETASADSLLDSIENRSELGKLASHVIETSANKTMATLYLFRDFRRASLANDRTAAQKEFAALAKRRFGSSLVKTSVELSRLTTGTESLDLNQ